MNKILYGVIIITFSIVNILSTPNAYAYRETNPGHCHLRFEDSNSYCYRGDSSSYNISSSSHDDEEDNDDDEDDEDDVLGLDSIGHILYTVGVAATVGLVVLTGVLIFKVTNNFDKASFDNEEAKDDRIKPYLRLENDEVQTGFELSF